MLQLAAPQSVQSMGSNEAAQNEAQIAAKNAAQNEAKNAAQNQRQNAAQNLRRTAARTAATNTTGHKEHGLKRFPRAAPNAEK